MMEWLIDTQPGKVRDIPAFPTQPWPDKKSGMALSDYFAAKAMQGILLSPDQMANLERAYHEDNEGMSYHEFGPFKIAQKAYEMAHAMLKARSCHPTSNT